jgi:hypothetical protein
MQNEPPPEFSPQLPPYPPYTLAPMRGPESARAIVLGMLNIFFGYVYAFVTLTLIAGSDSSLPVAGTAVILILGLAWAAIGLFLGGILLIKRSSSGIGLTKSVLWVVLGALVVTMCSTISQVASRYYSQLFMSYAVLVCLLCFYPLIASIVVNKPPEEMGM